MDQVYVTFEWLSAATEIYQTAIDLYQSGHTGYHKIRDDSKLYYRFYEHNGYCALFAKDTEGRTFLCTQIVLYFSEKIPAFMVEDYSFSKEGIASMDCIIDMHNKFNEIGTLKMCLVPVLIEGMYMNEILEV